MKDEILLQSLINSQQGLILFSLDREYRYTVFSKSHKDTMKLIWGVEISVGMNMLDAILDEEDRQKAKKNFDRALAGESFTLVEEYGDAANRAYWENRYAPILNRENNIEGVSVFVFDVTESINSTNLIREKEALYRTTLYSIGDAVITTDVNGNVQYVNPVAEKLTGWAESEAFGKPIDEVFNIISEETGQPIETPIRKVLTEGLVVGLANHTLLISKDGREIPIADSGAPIKTDEGNIIGVVLVFRDQTEEKKKLREIDESKKRLKLIFDNNPRPMHLVNNNFEILLTNKTLLDMKGVKQEDIVGKHCYEVYQNRTELCEKCAISQVLESKKASSIETKIKVVDGTYKYFRTSAFPILTKDNEIVEIVESTEDITKEKIAERKLREKESLFRTTLYSIGDAVITTDSSGEIRQLNPVAERITGWTESEAVGKPINEVFNIINEQTGKPVDTPVIKVLTEGLVVGLANHTLLISKDGREIPIADSGAPIKDDKGNIIGVVLVFRDQTEEREKQKKLETVLNRTSAVLQTLPDIIFEFDFVGNITNIFGNVKDSFYENTDEFIGKSVRDVMSSEISRKVMDYIANVKAAPELETFEYSIKMDNRAEYYEARIVLEGEENFLVLIRRITEIKEAEIKSRENLRNYRLLTELSPNAVAVHSKGKVVYVNDAAVKIFGAKSKEDLLGKPVLNFVHPDYAEFIKKRIIDILNKGKVFPPVEEKLIRLDGKEICTITASAPIFFEGVFSILVVITDITKKKEIENKLKESYEYKRILFEHSGLPLVVIDPDTNKFIDCNEAAVKIYGYKDKAEVLTKGVLDVSAPFQYDGSLSKDLTIKMIKTALDRGNVTFEWKHERPDGEQWDAQVNLMKFQYQGKELLQFSLQDITEQKAAKLALLNSENRFRILTESTTAAIFVFDKSKFLFVNKSTERITGYTSKELLQMNFWDVVHPDYREIVAQRGRQRVKGENIVSHYEFKIVNKSGKTIWLDFTARKIIWTKTNAALGSAVDITRRKQIEESLKKSEERYKIISNLTNDYVFQSEIDEAGNNKTIWTSNAFKKITGYTFDEFSKIGGWISLVHPDDREIEKETYRKILDNKIGKEEIRIRRKDGNVIWIQSIGFPIWDKEKKRVVGIIGAVTDISERKKFIVKLKEARKKAEISEQMKSEFLAQMSHEIRSPLNVILNFVSLLRDEFIKDANEDVAFAFSAIDSASRRIIRTIDLILNTIDVKSGAYETITHKVKPVELLGNILSEYKMAAEAKKIYLIFNAEVTTEEVIIDDFAFIQIFVNLIDNAIKYTKEGFVKVTAANNSSGDLVVTVEDTGIGISSDFLPKLFSRFTQEQQGYKRAFDGNGLGMALVKNYVDIIGGEIFVESEKDKGTIFTVIIPTH